MAAVVGSSGLKRLLQLGATRTLPLQCAGASVRCVASFSSLVHQRAFPALAAGLRTSVLPFPNSAGRQLSSEAVEVTPEDVEVTKPAKRSRGVQKDIQEISTLPAANHLEGLAGPPPRRGKDWIAQLHVKAFDAQVAEYACGYLQHLAGHLGVRTGNVVRLPKRRKLYTLLRSPHVNKTAQEQFARDTYKRLLCLYDTAPETLDVFYREVEQRPPVGVLVKITDKRGVHLPLPAP